MGFHNVRFPLSVSFGATGGPERRTEIVTLGSGREERNQRWAVSRRRYDAGTGIRNKDDLQKVVGFFEERRGRLYGFRYHDPLDHKSCAPSQDPSPQDQELGVGDGTQRTFPLVKRYGDEFAPYDRAIALPVAGKLEVAVAGLVRHRGTDYTFDDGAVNFAPYATPQSGAVVTAGFVFDVPVRFDTDRLDVDLSQFAAGAIPSVPLVEIVL